MRWVVSRDTGDGTRTLVPRIYHALARQKKLVRQLSEQKRRRKARRRTGLARIVVEFTAGQVAKRFDWDEMTDIDGDVDEDERGRGRVAGQKDLRDVVEQLRRMKAA